MTICDSLLSLLFSIPLDFAKNLGVIFIPDEGSGGYRGISVFVKDLLRAQSGFLSRTYLYSRLDPRCKGEDLVEYVFCGLLFHPYFLSSLSSDWLVSKYICQHRFFLHLSFVYFRLR